MELISKDDVIKALQKWNCRDSASLTINPYEVLRDIPTIEERKEGEWITEYNGNGWDDFWDYTCSVCGKKYERADILYKTNFCPNCGARMKGE